MKFSFMALTSKNNIIGQSIPLIPLTNPPFLQSFFFGCKIRYGIGGLVGSHLEPVTSGTTTIGFARFVPTLDITCSALIIENFDREFDYFIGFIRCINFR